MTGTILITGASGFIGSALAKRCLTEEMPIIATARRRTDVLSRDLGISVTPLDVMGALPDFGGVDTLVHCATPNDIQSRADDGALPLAVVGTQRLLHHAAQHGVRRIVYLSTLQVYGTELSGTVDEQTPVRCETLYGLNHYLGEEVCRYIAHTTEIDVVVLRPSNVYGVPVATTVERDTLVPMCFVKEACQTGAVSLRSSGRQRRNFVSTDEVAETILTLLRGFPNGYNIVNAVSGWTVSIRDIADMVGQVWMNEMAKPLDVKILSEHPARANDFDVRSLHTLPRLSPGASRARMASVITHLIHMHTQP